MRFLDLRGVRTCAIAVLAVTMAACATPVLPSHFAPYSQTDLRLGTGAVALSDSIVRVHYTGWLYDENEPEQKGPVFDTSRLATGEPFSFTLGLGGVIEGWDRGVPGMRIGGLRRLVIPPGLGYGFIRSGPVPPHATLVFEVELVGIGLEEEEE